MRKIYLLIVIFFSTNFVLGQQEQMYSHYDVNSMSFNPAYTGMKGQFSALALVRRQWTGFAGAPNYNTLNVEQPLNSDFAVGLNISQGSIGDFKNASPLRELHIGANLGYHKTIADGIRLAVGVRLGYYAYNLNLTQLDVKDANDPDFQNSNYSISAPMAGFGTLLYSEKFFVGFASPQMVFLNSADNNYTYNSKLHYYATGGYVFDLTDKFKSKVTTQIRMVEGAPVQVDFNLHLIYLDNISVGTFVRTEGDVGLMISGDISPKWRLFYSWDSKIQPLNEYVRNSHEFGLKFQLPTNKWYREVLPRYF